MKRLILASVLVVAAASALTAYGDGFFRRIRLGSAGQTVIRTGTSSPNSAVSGSVGDLFLRTDGSTATTLYIKESGSATTTGWTGSGGVSAATSDVFTNKTLDAEGTGNIVTVPFKLWIPAAVCNNVTATAPSWSLPTSNPAVAACQTGTNTQKATLDFADGAPTISAQTTLMLPADWTGSFGITLKWYAGSATTGNVVWQVATICVADAETSDPAFNTASTVTDAAKGTINQDNDATIASVTTTGCAAGELMYLRVFRDPANASDTMADTAHLRGVELTLRRAM